MCISLFHRCARSFATSACWKLQTRAGSCVCKGRQSIVCECYISRVYGGASSDGFITTHCGFLDHLQVGDHIMADKGFDIRSAVEKKGAFLNLPPFRDPGRTQFSEDEVKTILNHPYILNTATLLWKIFKQTAHCLYVWPGPHVPPHKRVKQLRQRVICFVLFSP